ncbi:NfeD family protein [Thermocoleostomius sinensis]|uniref:NfeD family protein n=1 Tax=Thermocoleostomius sinensis A174 TaxID=2016057 RepID=A0A9E9C6M6_9CYAN|nr:NfeD family protein [Thermocoleostomius sinensis]WAL58368.1 NfeD family protein [Thermocoleostomius sinensis A174]
MNLTELMTDQPYAVWLVLGFLFLVLGTLVGEPIVASLGIAALITAMAALTVTSVTTQIVIWGVLSIALAVVLRGMVPKQAKDLAPSTHAVVSETIPKGGTGLVSYDGALWKARCQISDATLLPGEAVQVVSRQGLTLIVMPTTFPDSELHTYSDSDR